jgi:hypothetical protein
MTQTKALELIDEYQRTNDERVFAILLAKYDELLMKVVNEQKRLNTYMQRDPPNELYHMAVLGFSNAIKVIPPTENPCKIPAWIKSYVKHSFDACYKAQVNDHALGKTCNAVDLEPPPTQTYTNTDNSIDVTTFLKCTRLTAVERKILKLHYIDNMTLKTVASKLENCTVSKTQYMKDCALRKLNNCCTGKFMCKKKQCMR